MIKYYLYTDSTKTRVFFNGWQYNNKGKLKEEWTMKGMRLFETMRAIDLVLPQIRKVQLKLVKLGEFECGKK